MAGPVCAGILVCVDLAGLERVAIQVAYTDINHAYKPFISSPRHKEMTFYTGAMFHLETAAQMVLKRDRIW